MLDINSLVSSLIELPYFNFSPSAEIDSMINLSESQGTNIPSIPETYTRAVGESSSGSGEPGNSGSNSSGGTDLIRNFEAQRRSVGLKLRDLYVNKPYNTRILMTSPDYSTKIDAWDHNVVCKSILDANSDLYKNIELYNDRCQYNGYITLKLLDILER